MISNIEKVESFNSTQLRKDHPHFNVGDTIKMKIKVKEAEKVRVHPFEGTVIKKTGRGIAEAFTVRKVSSGEGVERVFMLYSPNIERIEVIKRGKVQRSKLYYLRQRTGKSASKVDAADKEAQAS